MAISNVRIMLNKLSIIIIVIIIVIMKTIYKQAYDHCVEKLYFTFRRQPISGND